MKEILKFHFIINMKVQFIQSSNKQLYSHLCKQNRRYESLE